MKIAITFDLGEPERRAIANYFGNPGLANHQQAKNWIKATVRADLESIGADEDLSAARLQEFIAAATVEKKGKT